MSKHTVTVVAMLASYSAAARAAADEAYADEEAEYALDSATARAEWERSR